MTERSSPHRSVDHSCDGSHFSFFTHVSSVHLVSVLTFSQQFCTVADMSELSVNCELGELIS